MEIKHLFAGVAVSDFAAACDWYQRLFGCQPDAFPHEREAIWHTGAAHSVYVTADAALAGRGLLTLAVKDLEETRAGVEERGLLPARGSEANGLATLSLTDPDGNRIKLFEDPAVTKGARL